MKHLYLIRVIGIIVLLLGGHVTEAQQAGSNMYNAINAGDLNNPFTDTKNNSPANGYGNDYGQPSDDIFYRFTLNQTTEVKVSHCSSAFDTYLHILDANGYYIASNDDNGPLCATLQGSLKIQLQAGTYYVVSEGYGSYSGNITTSISNNLPIGATRGNAIKAGVLSPGITFTSTKNNTPTNGYGNDIGQQSDDIYYTFTLSQAREVEISHCASAFDTYMHLLDNNGNVITTNDDNGPLCSTLQASMKVQLQPGTYYVVSEGYGTNSGSTTTEITAVSTNETDYKFSNYADYSFQSLDKSNITTGALYDRVFPLASLHTFNQTRPDTSANSHFIQAYSEMRSATYNNSSLRSVKDLKDLVFEKVSQGLVPIGLGNFEFNTIDTTSIESGLLQQVDNLFYDVPNRPRHPFKITKTFLASPLVDSVFANVTFSLSSPFLINQSSRNLTSLQVDFGDGLGNRAVSLNSTIAVNYPSPGFKVLKFTGGFSDGATVTTNALLKVRAARIAVGCESNIFPFKSKLAFQGYEETKATRGIGQIKFYYATNTCDMVLRKPIIVMDGFDPGDEQDIDKIYKDYLDDPNKGQLATKLRAEGFDIVILNFNTTTFGTEKRDGGADFIERNARILINLIDTLNTLKNNAEKLVVIGPSMGGLISRYALTYMEQNNMPHNTSLWISFDSPHQGANIPIGDQHFINFYADRIGTENIKETRDKKIGSIAAQQMLVHHYKSNSSTPQGSPNYRDRFQQTIDQMGFPVGDPGKPIRKIALINGSLWGNETNLQCEKGFTFDIRHTKTRVFLFKTNLKTVILSTSKMYFTPSFGGSCTSFEGTFPFNGDKKNTITPSYTSGYDVAPGGTYDTQKILQRNGTGITGTETSHTIAGKMLNLYYSGFLNVKSEFYSVKPSHSFIGTKSALAFSGTNKNLSENLSTRSLVCTSETPFNSYYGPVQNEPHVALSEESTDFVLNEIRGTPSKPVIKALTISGPSTVCANQTVTYSFPSQGAGAVYIWSVQNLSIISGQNTSTIQVQAMAGSTGNRSVELQVTTPCSIFMPPKITVTSNISNNFYIVGPSNICPGEIGYFSVSNTNMPGVTSYQWSWPSDWTYFGGQNTPNLEVRAPSGAFYSGQIVLRVGTSCGLSDPVVQHVMENTNGCYQSLSFVSSPNPVDDYVEVKAKKKDKDGNSVDLEGPDYEQLKDTEVKIYDKYNKVIKTGKLKNGSFQFNTHDLSNDIYIIHIIHGKEIIKDKIMVSHK